MIKLEMKLPRTKMGSKILPLKLKFLVQVEKNKLNLYVISGKNLHTLNTQLIYNLANSMNFVRILITSSNKNPLKDTANVINDEIIK